MKKRIMTAIIAAGMMMPNISTVAASEISVTTSKLENVYMYNASSKMDEYSEAVVSKPTYIIYPDQAVNETSADQLLEDLKIKDHLDKYATSAYIINPGEDGYGEKENQDYLNMVDTLIGSSMNTKVIGIGEGATFVNEYVSQKDWMLSGIMTYGGQIGKTPKYSVPTYVSQSKEGVELSYIEANNAKKVTNDTKLTKYANEENKFETVVVNNTQESLSDAFANAWDYIFSQNGRLGNITGTFYTMKDSVERPFEYTSFFMAEKYGLTRNVVKGDLDNDGINSLWYEYLPEATKNAAKNSVPLVILLHGNGNDPRTQIETSGWGEVAAKNNIMLVEPEWQGSTIGNFAYDPMTSDDSSTEKNDIITLVNQIKAKYPQIDASRIYIEGLSRGSRNSLHIGLVHPEVFAGIGVHSGGINPEFVDGLGTFTANNADKYDLPVYMAIGTKDVFDYLPVASAKGGKNIQVAIQYYQQLNNLPVTTNFTNDQYYGISGADYQTVENDGSLVIKNTTLTNNKGVSISLNAIENYGHWNYEPTASKMWEFFKQYSRDLQTGEIIVAKEEKPEDKPEQPEDKVEESVNTGDNTNIILPGFTIMTSLLALVLLKRKITN